MAASRSPATEDLHLEAAGVATDERGYITVDDQLRTIPIALIIGVGSLTLSQAISKRPAARPPL